MPIALLTYTSQLLKPGGDLRVIMGLKNLFVGGLKVTYSSVEYFSANGLAKLDLPDAKPEGDLGGIVGI